MSNEDAWTPKTPPKTDKVEDALRWTFEEFQSQLRFVPRTLQLAVNYVAPDRPRTGMLAYADGTHWNPGAGEGLYVHKVTVGWVLLG